MQANSNHDRGSKTTSQPTKRGNRDPHEAAGGSKSLFSALDQGVEIEVRDVGSGRIMRLSGRSIKPSWVEIGLLEDGTVNFVAAPLPKGSH